MLTTIVMLIFISSSAFSKLFEFKLGFKLFWKEREKKTEKTKEKEKEKKNSAPTIADIPVVSKIKS